MLDACFLPRFSANRRCQQIGLDEMFPDIISHFPCRAELIDLKKEKNFFVTLVTEDQTGRGVELGLTGESKSAKDALFFCGKDALMQNEIPCFQQPYFFPCEAA